MSTLRNLITLLSTDREFLFIFTGVVGIALFFSGSSLVSRLTTDRANELATIQNSAPLSPTQISPTSPPLAENPATAVNFPETGTTAKELGARTKTTGCKINKSLPDPACTPGAVLPDATKEKICATGYNATIKGLSEATKSRVYAAYGITSYKAGEYEIDHLIPAELGGSNDIANLWPQAAKPTPGFHEKDVVEIGLYRQVCKGLLSLKEAQNQQATNWHGE